MWTKRYVILEKAYKRFKPNSSYESFVNENKEWLEDFALFMSVKEKFEFRQWIEWPEDIKLREPAALDKYKKELEDKINFHKFIQFKFFEQFDKLKFGSCFKDDKVIFFDTKPFAPRK